MIRRSGAVLAGLALLVLPACSADAGAPQGLPPAPSSAPPTTVPLPSPQASGVAGEVERAVLAYYGGLNEMVVRSDPAPFRATFTDDCTQCEAFASSLEALFAEGQRLDGAQDEVQDVRVVLGSRGSAAADVRYRISAYRVLDADGEVVEEFPAEQASANLALFRQDDGRFLVVSVSNAAAGS